MGDALEKVLRDLGERAKAASRTLAGASSAQKDAALHAAADLLEDRLDEVLAANATDVERAQRPSGGERAAQRPSGGERAASRADATIIDRLRLNPARVGAMATGLRKVAALPDPVGEVVDGWVRPNGLRIRRVRVPLGVVGIIYENRPNVTSDAAGLCVKSGNAAFLRGSSAAISSNRAIAEILRQGMAKEGLPQDSVVLVEDISREGAVAFMRLRGLIDCLVPRGGPSLIAAIVGSATVPYVIDGDGNCHVYVDAAADLTMATDIVVNAKTQRPSVCNAAESLVVHADVAERFLPTVARALDGVELVGDERARAIVPMGAASEEDFGREFLDLKMSVAVVDDLDAAIDHIARHGSGHTEAIVTTDLAAATRFTDGEEFGFGAEIGISTQKLHARGPMGLRELTTTKYVVEGEGQVRA